MEILKKYVPLDLSGMKEIMYQLVISLLDQAFPSGPDKTTSTKESYKVEREKGIKVSTAIDSGLFGPSWSLKAHIIKINNNCFKYNFFFTFDHPERESEKMSYLINGSWEIINPSREFPNKMPITDWKLYWLKPIKKELKDSTLLEYGATPKNCNVNTLADVRMVIGKRK